MTFQLHSNKASDTSHHGIDKANALQYAPTYNARATRLQARINSYISRHQQAICVDVQAVCIDKQ